MFDCHERVNDQVFHPGNEVLLHCQLVLREVLVQVLLKCFETNSVAFFVHSIVGPMLLQAVVGEMNIVVAIWKTVVIWRGPQVTLLVEEDLVLAGHQSPHTDVKLPLLEQHGALDVLLHYAAGILCSGINEEEQFIQIREYLNPSPLVGIAWLH